MKYAWHVVNIFALLIGVWGYGIFGSAFVNAQPKYQWILAFLNPLIREINFHLIYLIYYIGISIRNLEKTWPKINKCEKFEKIPQSLAVHAQT